MNNRLYILLYLLVLNVAAAAALWFIHPYFEWEFPLAFWGLIILFILSIHYFLFHADLNIKVKYPTIPGKNFTPSILGFGPHILFGMRLAAIWLMVVSLARPQSKDEFESSEQEGIDIMMALDISESMLAKDFKPNRLEAAKDVGIQFVDARPDDRIGLAVFQAEAFTQVPLTTDHRVVKNVMTELKPGLLESGTAIGMGLATAVNRLKQSTAASKVVILLTDGMDNSGAIRPLDAAAIAKTFGIRVYSIGMGTNGKALQPVAIDSHGNYVFDWADVEIDEDVLKSIANLTGGKYFRATTKEKLSEVYKEIDQLEKTKFQVSQYSRRNEEFWRFLLPGIVILLLEFLARNTIFKTTP